MERLEQMVTILSHVGQYDDSARVLMHSVGLVPQDECSHERTQPGDNYCGTWGKRLIESLP